MSCTDPEFAKSMRRQSAEELFGGESPLTVEELEQAAAPALAMVRLADVVVMVAHAKKRHASLDQREALAVSAAQRRAEAEALHSAGLSGAWVGHGLPSRYGRPAAGVCFDCGWTGRITGRDNALADVVAHRC